MELKPFDLLFVRGDTPIISKMVSRITNSPYSHVAVVTGKRTVVETNWWYPLQERFLRYHPSSFDVYRYSGEFSSSQLDSMESFINNNIGADYDLWQSITHGIYLLTGLPITDDAKKFNCSEFVDRLFKSAEIDLSPEVDGHVTPADLAKSNLLTKINI